MILIGRCAIRKLGAIAPDRLYAEYVSRGVEFTRLIGDMPWHSREFVVKTPGKCGDAHRQRDCEDSRRYRRVSFPIRRNFPRPDLTGQCLPIFRRV